MVLEIKKRTRDGYTSKSKCSKCGKELLHLPDGPKHTRIIKGCRHIPAGTRVLEASYPENKHEFRGMTETMFINPERD